MNKLILGGLAAAAMTIQALPLAAAEYPKMTLRFAHIAPARAYLSKVDTFFAEEVEKRSGGNIKIKIFWSNALGSESEMIDLIGSGAVDLGALVTGYYFSRLPLAGMTNSLPATFYKGESVVKITRDLFENDPAVKEELEKANLRPILYRHLPEYRLICTKPVRTFADLKGKKVRTYGAYIPVMFKSFGAVPVNLMVGEVYESLKRGTIDCSYFPYSILSLFKLYEAANYVMDANFGVINAFTIMTSRDNWNKKWPESVRKLMTEVAAEAEKMAFGLTATAEGAALENLKKNATLVHFEDQDKIEAAGSKMFDVWVAKMEQVGKGKEARRIVDYVGKQMKRP